MKNYKKGFIVSLLLSIITVLVLGGMVYIYTQKNSQENKGPNFEVTKTPDVIATAKDVLIAYKVKDYVALEYLTSSEGLSWSEYPHLDLSKNDIPKSEISNIPTNSKKYLFGYTDGKGDPINLTMPDYLDKWIFNHEYLEATEIVENKVLGSGNSLNTILQDAENRRVVAFHFKGFDPKYNGTDWTTLYMVFDLENGKYKLRGLAKDNWTI